MKQLIISFFALLLLGGCHHVTGSGNIITEKRGTGEFNGVDIGGGFTAEVRIGSATEVVVEADDNVISRIKTNVENGILHVYTRGLNNTTNVHLKVYITTPELTTVKGSAAANVEVRNQIQSGGKVKFAASSGATVQAEVDAPEVEADASSAGTLQLTGHTRMYDASASSGAGIKSWNLMSEDTKVSASSGANASVHASIKLRATASSGGNVSYHGAANVEINESSGGDVSKKD
jgi:hypothetical protein